MKIIYSLTLLIIILIGNPVAISAQTANTFNPMKDDIGDKLPILQVLIDSAVTNNPYVKFRDQQIIVNESKLRTKKVEWTRNLGLQANVGYGNLYNYSTNSTGGIDPLPFATNRVETQYNGSVYLNMPLYTLVDRKNQIKMARTEIEQATFMAEEQRLETRQLVIRQYNELLLAQRILRIKARYMETARINMQMVEKEFSNGVVSVTELTRITEIVSRSESDYESARTDFLTAYLILEELTGMKFYLTHPISGKNDGN
ncbi:MAG: hypothetical protein CVT94_18415 [Bacteroidetes bacterium HGW-Bacteroidetes-11]|jgi:outer membrane protein TolC|nr:MAG: hypothetical protein CVT94_18415 [Bacteroidetes bacterium HGW-Bacteroidetes-11]